MIRGVVRENAQSGYALLTIPLEGSRESGVLYVVANRARKEWRLTRAALWTTSDGRRLNLSPPTRHEPFHYPAQGPVYLVPLDGTAAAELGEMPAYYTGRLGIHVEILPVSRPGDEAIERSAMQVIAERAIDHLERSVSKLAENPAAVILGITSQDLKIRSSASAFNSNFRSGHFAVLSAARLHDVPWAFWSNPEAFPSRVRKLVTKNLAFLRYPIALSADP
jgi:hypothetical protein